MVPVTKWFSNQKIFTHPFSNLTFKILHMPIYAYQCTNCGHAKDVLQKMSDATLTQCPSCQSETFNKQVTAAGFQLKGSGWYASDFKNTIPTSSASSSSAE